MPKSRPRLHFSARTGHRDSDSQTEHHGDLVEQPRAAPCPPHCPAQLGHSTGVAVPGVAVTGVAVPGVAVTGVAVPVMFLLLRTCGWKEQRDPKSSMAGSGSGSAAAVRLGDLHSTDGSPGISKRPPCRAAEGSVAPRSCRREAELARQARAHRARHGHTGHGTASHGDSHGGVRRAPARPERKGSRKAWRA